MRPQLRARIIRELRAHRFPLSTGELARRCAWAVRYPTQRTLTELLRLEACGVATRHAKVKCAGRGRPSVSWTLKRSAA